MGASADATVKMRAVTGNQPLERSQVACRSCLGCRRKPPAKSIVEPRFPPAFVSINAAHVVSDADAARCCGAFSQASTHLILSVLDRCERTDLASANRADPPIAHVHQLGAEQIRRHVNRVRPI